MPVRRQSVGLRELHRELKFPKDRIIFNDISLKGDDCTATENCYGKSMIDVVEQYRELGAFLGVEEGPELQAQFADLCEASNEFSAHMKTAHEKGVRTMASYVDPTSGFYASPVNDVSAVVSFGLPPSPKQ